MNSTIFYLFYEFFKIGLLTFGGGFGSLPFLYELIEKYHWFNYQDLANLIALSSLTPGPIGLNMATFCGFNTLEIKGAIFASFALILPMIIFTTIIYKFWEKFYKNSYVKSVLYVLRPTSCALIFSVAIQIFYDSVLKNSSNFKLNSIDFRGLIILFVLFLLTFKLNKNPIIYMVLAGILGILFKNFL